MIVSRAAGERLTEILKEAEVPEGFALRIAPKEGSLTLIADSLRPGDLEYEHEGRVVLVVGERVAARLADRNLDVVETERGPTLSFVAAKG